MDGIADMGGVVGRSATYALAREEPALAERGEGPALAPPSACNRLIACSLYASRRAVERCQLTDYLGADYLGPGHKGVEVEDKFAPPPSLGGLVFAGLEGRLADCGSILAEVASVHAQELSDRPTDDDRER
jgi:hypothetical protein